MIEQVTEAIAALQGETTNYPPNVQIWMKLMGISFMASVVFIYSKSGARWILLALVFGIMESGWFFSQQVELNNAAREGARLAVVDYGTAAVIATETCARAALSGSGATVTVTRSVVLDPEVGDPPGTPESVTVMMAKNYSSLTGFLDPFFDGLAMSSTVEMRIERPLENLTADGGGACP